MPPAQHWQAPAELHDAIPSTHFLQLDGLHEPPLDPPLDEDEEAPPPLHMLLWQVAPTVVQSEHVSPEPPQTVSIVPCWHVPVESQQPVHGPHVLAGPSSPTIPASPPSSREPNPG
jgi:hypothetical protein